MIPWKAIQNLPTFHFTIKIAESYALDPSFHPLNLDNMTCQECEWLRDFPLFCTCECFRCRNPAVEALEVISSPGRIHTAHLTMWPTPFSHRILMNILGNMNVIIPILYIMDANIKHPGECSLRKKICKNANVLVHKC